MFHTTATVERRTVTFDSVGDPSESWSTILSGASAAIRNYIAKGGNNENIELVQGKQYVYHAKAYLKGSVTVAPEAGDRLTDDTTGITYNVVGSYPQYAASSLASGIHHHRVLLQNIDALKS